MQVVADAELSLIQATMQNPMCANLRRDIFQNVMMHGAWSISDSDHNFMLNGACHRSAFDFEEVLESVQDLEGEDESETDYCG